MDTTIIIPTYKHTERFLQVLRGNIKHFAGARLIVVNDDPSTPELAMHIRHLYSNALTIQQPVNRGFSEAINTALEHVETPFIFLLNNDVILHNDTWKKALRHFQNDAMLFAVALAQKEKDGSIVGANTGEWKNGLFHHRSKSTAKTSYTLWPEGGSSLLRTSHFRMLQGYTHIYNPFYWEDVDLGYRAWKRGYSILFDRDIVVEHHHETTIGSLYSKEYIATIASRNQLYFTWRNADDGELRTHFATLPKLIATQYKKNYPFVRGFSKAILHLPQILMSRKTEMKQWKRTSQEVLALI